MFMTMLNQRLYLRRLARATDVAQQFPLVRERSEEACAPSKTSACAAHEVERPASAPGYWMPSTPERLRARLRRAALPAPRLAWPERMVAQ